MASPKVESVESLLTPADVARRLRVAIGTLRNWRYQGTGPTFLKLRGVIRYDNADVETWIATSRETGDTR